MTDRAKTTIASFGFRLELTYSRCLFAAASVAVAVATAAVQLLLPLLRLQLLLMQLFLQLLLHQLLLKLLLELLQQLLLQLLTSLHVFDSSFEQGSFGVDEEFSRRTFVCSACLVSTRWRPSIPVKNIGRTHHVHSLF